MNRYFKIVLLSICLTSFCSGSSIEESNKIALKYLKQEFTYYGSLPAGYTGDVNKRMYLERLIQLKDGKLNAYYAKDLIKKHLSMYEHFVKTGISWKGGKVTKEDEKRFNKQIEEFKSDLEVVETHYPKDLKVYDRIDKVTFGTSE